MSTEEPRSRDENWAKPVPELHVSGEVPAGALNLNVEGHRVAAMGGGFGKMWQKTYRAPLEGAGVTPQEVVAAWKERFGSFWPPNARFYGALEGISPGDVALINMKTGGVRMSTGILVLYADDVSFSFISPEGHPFTGMITFSSHEEAGTTVAQIQVLIRAQDPLYELGMMFGGHRSEDKQWTRVLNNLGSHFGIEARPTVERVCVDRKRQWSQWRNIRRNAGIRSALHSAGAPVRLATKPFRKRAT